VWLARPGPIRKPSITGGYFKISFAALLALSAPEPPPFDLLLDLLLDPFLEVPPDFSTNFLASFPISDMRPSHAPSPSGVTWILMFLPQGPLSETSLLKN
jgi:hypothetical protein